MDILIFDGGVSVELIIVRLTTVKVDASSWQLFNSKELFTQIMAKPVVVIVVFSKEVGACPMKLSVVISK